jgi:hypothetical protein
MWLFLHGWEAFGARVWQRGAPRGGDSAPAPGARAHLTPGRSEAAAVFSRSAHFRNRVRDRHRRTVRRCMDPGGPVINTQLVIRCRTGLNFLQPEGLEEGSRWSRGNRGATTGIRRPDWLHPGRGARTVLACQVTSVSGTPPGCSPTRRVPGGRYPFAPERPPATLFQPFGLSHRGVVLASKLWHRSYGRPARILLSIASD